MREIKFIERPEVLDPCADCGETIICPRCLEGIETVLTEVRPRGKNWYGEDGDIFVTFSLK